MKVLLLLTVAFFGICLSDFCISRVPSLPKGAACGNAVPCQMGYYCGETGTCTPQVAAGGSCNLTYPGMCAFGTTCLGLTGAQTCVAYASPGQACSSNSSYTTPACGSGPCIGGVCLGGLVGDSCYNSTDCNGFNCTGGICTPIISGGICSCGLYETFTSASGATTQGRCIQDYCTAGTSCQGPILNGFTFNYYCTPFLSIGSACPNSTTSVQNAQCPPGSYCIAPSPTSTNYVCVANGTLTAGSWCDSYDGLCASGICFNQYCAKSPKRLCEGACDAFSNTVCTCDGAAYSAGIGSCQTNPCESTMQALANCLYGSCYRPGVNLLTGTLQNQIGQAALYSKSCVNTNCATQFANYVACSEASRIFPYLAIVFTLIALVFNKF